MLNKNTPTEIRTAPALFRWLTERWDDTEPKIAINPWLDHVFEAFINQLASQVTFKTPPFTLGELATIRMSYHLPEDTVYRGRDWVEKLENLGGTIELVNEHISFTIESLVIGSLQDWTNDDETYIQVSFDGDGIRFVSTAACALAYGVTIDVEVG